MNYESFKKIIESKKKINKNTYDELVKKYGKDVINNFFEIYINDLNVADNLDKINRTSYYIELTSSTSEEKYEAATTTVDTSYVSDSLKMYLKEIGKISLLTPEEETEILKKIVSVKKIISQNNINIDNIDKKLELLGYNLQQNYASKNANDISRKLYELNKIINLLDITSNEKNITYNELVQILKDLKILCEYNELKEKFMNSNLRLVVSIAKRYVGRSLDLLDLIQEGNIGLDKAIDKFDIDKGFKFSTYATWWIRQGITRAIADIDKTIRIPVHLQGIVVKIKSVEAELEALYYRKPTDNEILEAFNQLAIKELENDGIINPTNKQIKEKSILSNDKLKEIRIYTQEPLSLSSCVGDDEESTLGDFICDSTNVEDNIIFESMKSFIKENLHNLSDEKSQLILILRFGLKLSDYMSFEDFNSAIKNRNGKSNTIVLKKERTNIANLEVTDENIKKLYFYLDNVPNVYSQAEVANLWNVTGERIRYLENISLKRLRFYTRGKRNLVL